MKRLKENTKYYAAIDLKSFYASVECADRNLNPLTTNLVVADPSRTEKTICLAVSPSLKAYGISGRARLFEVIQQISKLNHQRLSSAIHAQKAIIENGLFSFSAQSYDTEFLSNNPFAKISYIVAPPRMARYIEISAKIYSIYLKYFSTEDIHCYSIDEVFIDITPYLEIYHMTSHQLIQTIIHEILYETNITATAGIGTNLYLAKIAMDIVAKHIPADKDGVRIAELDEFSFRHLLWNHRPLTDFWRIGKGTASRLERMGIYTMGELASYSIYGQPRLYKEFGIDAELLIDHAWGYEPCEMFHIKNYQPENNSICEGQVLHEPYTYKKALIIIKEMTDTLILQLVEKNVSTDSITLTIGYDKDNLTFYNGKVHIDHYGRAVPEPAHGTTRLISPTNLSSQLLPAVIELYKRIANPLLTIRRITISANRIFKSTEYTQLDFFTNITQLEKEKKLQETILSIKKRFGKNSILRGTNFEEGSTMQERNEQIGGHKS